MTERFIIYTPDAIIRDGERTTYKQPIAVHTQDEKLLVEKYPAQNWVLTVYDDKHRTTTLQTVEAFRYWSAHEAAEMENTNRIWAVSRLKDLPREQWFSLASADLPLATAKKLRQLGYLERRQAPIEARHLYEYHLTDRARERLDT